MNELKVLAGLDIGNGFVKVGAETSNGLTVDTKFTSIVSSVKAAMTTLDYIDVNDTKQVESVIKNIFNVLDCTMKSPIVRDTNRYVFANAGISKYPYDQEQFNISSNKQGKSESDLSSVLILGTIAGIALQDYYMQHKALPTESISVDTQICLAIPISEYIHDRDLYKNKLTQVEKHRVNIGNFNLDCGIDIDIKFSNVVVIAEGSAAQYAISHFPDNYLAEAIVAGQKENLVANDFTINDAKNMKTFVSIDIGEGTVNFPVFVDRKFSSTISNSIDIGYGTALDRTIDRLKKEYKKPYNTRKQLLQFLSLETSYENKHEKALINKVLREESDILIKNISSIYSEILGTIRDSGNTVGVIYIYGGGSIPLKDMLYSTIKDITSRNNAYAQVLYIAEDKAQTLNRDGLLSIIKAKEIKTA